MRAQLRRWHSQATPLEQRESDALWRALRDQSHAFFTPREGMTLWRASVRLDAPRFGQASGGVIDWAGALHWLWIAPDREPAVREWARQHGGHASPWPPRRPAELPHELLRLQHRVLDVFDPYRIFARGRLLAAPAPARLI